MESQRLDGCVRCRFAGSVIRQGSDLVEVGAKPFVDWPEGLGGFPSRQAYRRGFLQRLGEHLLEIGFQQIEIHFLPLSEPTS